MTFHKSPEANQFEYYRTQVDFGGILRTKNNPQYFAETKGNWKNFNYFEQMGE